MTDHRSTENINIAGYQALVTPQALKERLPCVAPHWNTCDATGR